MMNKRRMNERSIRDKVADEVLGHLYDAENLIAGEFVRVDNLSVDDDVIFDDYLDRLDLLLDMHQRMIREWETIQYMSKYEGMV